MCYELKEVVGEGQFLGSSEDVAVNDDNVTGGGGAVEVHGGGLQTEPPPPQTQAPVVCWDRFLPVRSLKVLLVESDDPTRHVIAALLRNCSYEVIAVDNGLDAWGILEDQSNRIDIVLTEVAVPVLSGISLLCRIMSHKSFKNIPIIMMSTHDSMSLVFKCLSKGAVDFLVKPVRKNELKNLWQHVWRRFYSSSGSGTGSESGIQNKTSAKSKSNESDNSGSSDEHENCIDALIIHDGSDNGSGTQSSWTRRAVKVDSPQPMSPSNHLLCASDSICAQFICEKAGACENQCINIMGTRECQELDRNSDDSSLKKNLEIQVRRNPNIQGECQSEDPPVYPANEEQNGRPEAGSKQYGAWQVEHKNEKITVDCADEQAESINVNALSGSLDTSHVKGEAYCCSVEKPPLELKLQASEDRQNAAEDDDNILRHSDTSAFAKFGTFSSAKQAPNTGSCSLFDASCVAVKTETEQKFQSHASRAVLNHESDGSCNNDVASTAKCSTAKPDLNDKPESTLALKPLHSSAFQPVQNGHICPSKESLPAPSIPAQIKSPNRLFQVQQLRSHNEIEKQQHQPQLNYDILVKNTSTASPLSDTFNGPTETNLINCSGNGNDTRSYYGSNGPSGCSTTFNEQKILASSNGAAGDNGARIASERISGSGMDDGRDAKREAALNKFRQKRKERCFEKRARYHSRKKLADQRPRFKGQFVRITESGSQEAKDHLSNIHASEDDSINSLS